VVLVVVFWTGLRMAGVPEPDVTQKTLEQPLPASAPPSTQLETVPSGQDETVRPDVAWDAAAAVRVMLDMDEGEFTIEPGPAHEGIRVEADYDEATYDLKQEYSVDDDGHPVYLLRFKSKVSFLRRLAQEGGFESNDLQNTVRVQLPVDTPMELFLSLAKTEADVDLSGLALTNLVTKLRMGEVQLAVDELNPLEMESAVLNCGMGEFNLQGLSRLRAASIDLEGTMGEFTLDFDAALERDTQLVVHGKMGEITLRLPDNAIWDPEGGFKSTWADVTGNLENPRGVDPELSPVLTMNGGIFMGELQVDAIRVRSSGLRSRERD
jgi:hypothetical protein